MSYFAHQQSLVESDTIGDHTRIWAFAHVLPGARIGENCNICDHVFIENDVVIGNNVTIKCGVQVWDGISLEDNVFVGPNATFTNDPSPRSKQYPDQFFRTVVREGASIGANATILPGLTIGKNAMIGAGAVVTRDVPSNAIVVGNPAYIRGYASSIKQLDSNGPVYFAEESAPVRSSIVPGVTVRKLPFFADIRGELSFAEFGPHLPFLPQRYFLVYNVPSREVRGEHAHKELHQFLVCVRGSCAVLVDDGTRREEFVLDSPLIGLHIPPMVWGIQYKFSSDALLFVLASEGYKADDYIRDYDDYLKALKIRKADS